MDKAGRVLALMAELGLAPGQGAPNLDVQSPGVLGRVWLSFQQYDSVTAARFMFPHRPKGYVRATRDLGAYAANKGAALRLELAGHPERARAYVTLCEHIRACLPGYARW